MRYLLLLLVAVAWALWFGATLATFVFGLNLFHTHPAIAGEANSAMFLIFGKYEMILAAIALLASGVLMLAYPSKPAIVLFACFILVGGMAMTSGLGFTPRMEMLRAQGQSHSHEFRRLHEKSMIAMTAQAGMLLLSGAILLLAVPRDKPTPSTDPLTAGQSAGTP
jgi:hypothetical protein